jgi:hypothetical protein
LEVFYLPSGKIGRSSRDFLREGLKKSILVVRAIFEKFLFKNQYGNRKSYTEKKEQDQSKNYDFRIHMKFIANFFLQLLKILKNNPVILV